MFTVGAAFFAAAVAVAAVVSTDAFYASVVLLMHLDTNFSDVKVHIVGVTGAVISSTQKLFGNNTAHFNGTSDFLTLPVSADWNYGIADFTIEMFAYHETDTAPLRAFYSCRQSAVNPLVFGIYSGQYFVYDGSAFIIQAGAPSLGSWRHLALVRSGNVVTLYVGGVAVGSVTVSASRAYGSETATTHLGGDPDYSQFSSGYLSQIRITKGVARYTADFTPPTAPF